MFKPIHMAFFFGKKREKEALEVCKKHLDKVLETIAEMRKVVYALHDNDKKSFDRFSKVVFKREREADDTKRKVLDELSKGPFHPMDREDVIRLIFTFDDISTNAKAVVRKLSLVPLKSVKREVRVSFKEISDLVMKEAEKLKESYDELRKNPRKAIELTHEVEKIEEEIDDLRLDSLDKILDSSKVIKTVLMLKDAIDSMENVADRIEDSADIVRSIAITKI
jgi:hypothetical protein